MGRLKIGTVIIALSVSLATSSCSGDPTSQQRHYPAVLVSDLTRLRVDDTGLFNSPKTAGIAETDLVGSVYANRILEQAHFYP
ncbi:MAG: hypothetical protein ACRDAX_05800 [Propionibacteriaceae bacterium]